MGCSTFQGLSVEQSFFIKRLWRGFFFLLGNFIYFIRNFCDILNLLSRKCNKSCHFVPRQGFFQISPSHKRCENLQRQSCQGWFEIEPRVLFRASNYQSKRCNMQSWVPGFNPRIVQQNGTRGALKH
jgi:hypothetical protein